MATCSPLATSEPKTKFVERLGLDQPGCQHIYSIMKHEAAMAWRRLQGDRSSLRPHLRDQETVQRPFTFGQIHDAALNQEVFTIIRSADAETRPYYALDHVSGSLNWIVRWLLWHTFRDRDQRKRVRRGRAGPLDEEQEAMQDGTASDLGQEVDQHDESTIVGQGADQHDESAIMHDRSMPPTPALPALLPLTTSNTSGARSLAGSQHDPRLPYDPIRDC